MVEIDWRDADTMAGTMMRIGPPVPQDIRFTIDGRTVTAATGDTVLTAVLLHGHVLRHLEFGGARRAGFCLMGACQDCWMWTESGARLRACTTPVAAGMRLLTAAPSGWPA